MKKSLITLVFLTVLFFPIVVNAQLNHFIYLQTEGKQPFYAKLDKKVLSSSASGYLIIPKLKEGAYTITIGFPKNENGEQSFACNIDNRDVGYLIKNFGDKGWGLFNLQTLDVVMAGSQAKVPELAKAEKTDEFSNMLSDVVNDPAIKQAETKSETKAAVKKEEVKEAPKTDGAEKTAGNTGVLPMENKVLPVADQPLKALILKKQTIASEKGTEITYVDINGNVHDTITVFIPVESSLPKSIDAGSTNETGKTAEKQEPAVLQQHEIADKPKQQEIATEPAASAKQEVPAISQPPIEKKEQPAGDVKFLPIEVAPVVKSEAAAEQPSVTPMINSDCKNYATDEDFLKLRKKMAGADNDDDMIAAAQKSFKVKCYTTDQVKNLCVLFLKDAGKYRFFDLAYQYVSDSHNFGSLENQLTEAYFISRFKAMIRH